MTRHLSNRQFSDSDSDSFLDVIANLIGVMILIAAVIAVNLKNVTIPFGTPMTEKPPKELKKKEVVCSKGNVVILETGMHYYGRLRSAASSKFPKPTWNQLISHSAAKPIVMGPLKLQIIRGNDGYHRVKAAIEPADNTGLEDDSWEADWIKQLETLDPEKQFIYFLVDIESFQRFRRARQIARERGFRTGFKPGPWKAVFWRMDGPKSMNNRPVLLND